MRLPVSLLHAPSPNSRSVAGGAMSARREAMPLPRSVMLLAAFALAATLFILTPDDKARAQSGLSVGDPTLLTSNWALNPTDVGVGESFRLLLVTSGKRDAQSTDVADYNNFVQGQAAGEHAAIRPFSDQFKALISTKAVDARDNAFTHPNEDIPIYWLNGDKVADDYPTSTTEAGTRLRGRTSGARITAAM